MSATLVNQVPVYRTSITRGQDMAAAPPSPAGVNPYHFPNYPPPHSHTPRHPGPSPSPGHYGHSSHQEPDSWSPFLIRQSPNTSMATLENSRYSRDRGSPSSDHPNEDRHFSIDKPNYQVFAVFDGHDGPRAAGYASAYLMELFNTPSWKSVAEKGREHIPHALDEFFSATEKDFFQSIHRFVQEKERIQASIPSGLTSYQAYNLYPTQVSRLQEIEPKITGGTTAVLAVVCGSKLFIANCGDSRAVLVSERPDSSTLVPELLTNDHTVFNLDEIRRLERVGLDRRELEKNGRLGTQECTRSIGDYYVKRGYRDVDILRHAREPPGSAKPDIVSRDIESSHKYLILMSDGVYKSIEEQFEETHVIDPNKVVVNMLNRELQDNPHFPSVADRVLQRIASTHRDTYLKAIRSDRNSPKCRKRDDMSLVVFRLS